MAIMTEKSRTKEEQDAFDLLLKGISKGDPAATGERSAKKTKPLGVKGSKSKPSKKRGK